MILQGDLSGIFQIILVPPLTTRVKLLGQPVKEIRYIVMTGRARLCRGITPGFILGADERKPIKCLVIALFI